VNWKEFKRRYVEMLILLFIGLILLFVGISTLFITVDSENYILDIIGITLTFAGLTMILFVIGGLPIEIKHPRLFYLAMLAIIILLILIVMGLLRKSGF
jgi:hypothetical protein